MSCHSETCETIKMVSVEIEISDELKARICDFLLNNPDTSLNQMVQQALETYLDIIEDDEEECWCGDLCAIQEEPSKASAVAELTAAYQSLSEEERTQVLLNLVKLKHNENS